MKMNVGKRSKTEVKRIARSAAEFDLLKEVLKFYAKLKYPIFGEFSKFTPKCCPTYHGKIMVHSPISPSEYLVTV